jgi:hypothetical protein
LITFSFTSGWLTQNLQGSKSNSAGELT